MDKDGVTIRIGFTVDQLYEQIEGFEILQRNWMRNLPKAQENLQLAKDKVKEIEFIVKYYDDSIKQIKKALYDRGFESSDWIIK